MGLGFGGSGAFQAAGAGGAGTVPATAGVVAVVMTGLGVLVAGGLGPARFVRQGKKGVAFGTGEGPAELLTGEEGDEDPGEQEAEEDCDWDDGHAWYVWAVSIAAAHPHALCTHWLLPRIFCATGQRPRTGPQATLPYRAAGRPGRLPRPALRRPDPAVSRATRLATRPSPGGKRG